MDPAVIYILLVAMAVSVCSGAVFAWRPPKRACQACGEMTSLQQRRCTHCGYLTNR
jgi:hypothetical protein